MSASATSKYFKRDFTKSDIDKIDKIVIRYGNPLAQTTSGRMQIAETLLQNKLIDTPQEYLEVIETGSLTPLTQSAESQLHRIREENELLSKGDDVIVTPYDNHPLDIKEHAALLSSDEVRTNPKIIQAVQKHIQLHLRIWKEASAMTPEILTLLNIPVLPSAPATPPAGPTQGAPNPPSGGNNLPHAGAPTVPAPNGAGLPQGIKIPQALPQGV